jgi:DNA-binding GntR family transcriptional regulator
MTMNLGTAHRPLRDLVCDELRKRIIDGRMVPGERLVEKSLAEELGVSRNPVREAIRTLEWEGFVAVLPRRGAVVASLSESEAEEIQEVRAALQAEATALAARKRSESAVEELFVVLKRGEALIQFADGANAAELIELNAEFHETVLAMADNPYLADVIRPLRGRIAWMFSRSDDQRRAASWREHRAMAEAIAAGDESLAARLAEQHIGAGRVRTGGEPST